MPYSELQRRQDDLARHRENHGRMASASTVVNTTGVGVIEFDDPIEFGLIFVDQPRVHYGSFVDADDLRNVAELGPNDPLPLPRVSGSVVAWDQDENDHYVGAWVAVSITSDLVDIDQLDAIGVSHHFDFHGVALKVVPVDPTD